MKNLGRDVGLNHIMICKEFLCYVSESIRCFGYVKRDGYGKSTCDRAFDYWCVNHGFTRWLTALTVDPEAKRRMLGLARKVETEMNESWYEDFYHHLRMEMDEYRRLKRNLRVLKSYTDYEEDLYEEAV